MLSRPCCVQLSLLSALTIPALPLALSSIGLRGSSSSGLPETPSPGRRKQNQGSGFSENSNQSSWDREYQPLSFADLKKPAAQTLGSVV